MNKISLSKCYFVNKITMSLVQNEINCLYQSVEDLTEVMEVKRKNWSHILQIISKQFKEQKWSSRA